MIGADGLRPDQFDPKIMPTIDRLKREGTTFEQHRAMYPSHTRVNMTSLATGASPGQHGIVANTMLVPSATPDHIINTATFDHLDALDTFDARGAQFVPSMSQVIHANGKRFAFTGTGTTGAALLWTFRNRSRLVHPSSAFNLADLYDLREKLGEIPGESIPLIERNIWATRAVTDVFLPDDDIRAMTVWYAEPDSALHMYGLGSPEAETAMRNVDECVLQILDAMDRRGIRDQFDILFLSDHGHTTVRAHKSIREFLEDARAEIGDAVPPLATASDFIYPVPGTPPPNPNDLITLVEWLYAQPWVDIVSGPQEIANAIPSVMSLNDLWSGFTNDRAPLLAVSPAWNNDLNDFGVPGTVAALTTQSALRTSHGSLAPWDMRATLIASGPSFRHDHTSTLPTGAFDIAPTVLHLLGYDRPETMSGRILSEALMNAAEPPPSAQEFDLTVSTPGGHHRTVNMATVGSTTYAMGSGNVGTFN